MAYRRKNAMKRRKTMKPKRKIRRKSVSAAAPAARKRARLARRNSRASSSKTYRDLTTLGIVETGQMTNAAISLQMALQVSGSSGGIPVTHNGGNVVFKLYTHVNEQATLPPSNTTNGGWHWNPAYPGFVAGSGTNEISGKYASLKSTTYSMRFTLPLINATPTNPQDSTYAAFKADWQMRIIRVQRRARGISGEIGSPDVDLLQTILGSDLGLSTMNAYNLHTSRVNTHAYVKLMDKKFRLSRQSFEAFYNRNGTHGITSNGINQSGALDGMYDTIAAPAGNTGVAAVSYPHSSGYTARYASDKTITFSHRWDQKVELMSTGNTGQRIIKEGNTGTFLIMLACPICDDPDAVLVCAESNIFFPKVQLLSKSTFCG